MFKNKKCYNSLNKIILNTNFLNSIHCQLNLLKFKSKTSITTKEKNVIHSTEWMSAKPYDKIPTLSPLKLIRHCLPGGRYSNLDVTQFVMALKEDLGDICKLPGTFGQFDNILTHNVQDFEIVLRNEGIWPRRPGMDALTYHRTVHRADFFQGIEGLIATHGAQWGAFRSSINPVLMEPRNVRIYLPKMSRVNKEFVDRICEIRDPYTLEVPSSFQEDINRWALESVSVVALDKQLGLINVNRQNPRAKEMFTTLTEFLSLTLEIELKPSIWRYYKTPTFNKLMDCLDSLLEITTSYIDEAIERLEEERRKGVPEKPEYDKSVLEKLLKIDKKIATVMAIDMLMGGVDTTTSTYTSILLTLAKNPDKQAKLREEIMRILPHKNSDFTEEACRHMPYLRACIKEALRYYPVTIGNGRAPNRDVVLSGYRVPKGTRVTMVSIGLLRDEKHFARPNEYLPERWLRDTKGNNLPVSESIRPSSPFVYLPFGFGPRTCAGRRVVEMELELGIARLVRNFYIEFNYPTENAFKSVLINVPNIPLNFKFSDVEY